MIHVSALVSRLSSLDLSWPGTLCCVLGQDTTLSVPVSIKVSEQALAN